MGGVHFCLMSRPEFKKESTGGKKSRLGSFFYISSSRDVCKHSRHKPLPPLSKCQTWIHSHMDTSRSSAGVLQWAGGTTAKTLCTMGGWEGWPVWFTLLQTFSGQDMSDIVPVGAQAASATLTRWSWDICCSLPSGCLLMILPPTLWHRHWHMMGERKSEAMGHLDSISAALV